MSVETGEIVLEGTEKFSNILVLHGLRRALHDMGRLVKTDTMERLLSQLQLSPFEAPEGTAIEIVPQGKSREIPLRVEEFNSSANDWFEVRTDSDVYREAVEFRFGFDAHFFGTKLEVNPDNHEIYVVDANRGFRVRAEHDSYIDLVAARKQ